jgi:DNA-binding response OmpR family regulator
MNILIVEDHEPFRNGLYQILKHAGHEVVAAATLTEGLAHLDGQDAALVDWGLPDGSGGALLEHIRAQGAPLRVALMTGYGAALVKDAGRRLQPDAVFTKPLDLNRLFQWLEGVRVLLKQETPRDTALAASRT